MRRLLAIGDEDLQRFLHERFGGSGIQVNAASSVTRALVQALVERPEVIACAEGCLQGSLKDLRSELDELGLAHCRLVCVRDTGDPVNERLQGVVECTEEELFECVAALLPERREARWRRVRLLASCARLGGGEDGMQAFANLLALAERRVVLESPGELEPGERLALGFFLPRAGDGGQVRLSLTCTVRSVADRELLHYEAEVDHIDELSKLALLDFLSRPDCGEED